MTAENPVLECRESGSTLRFFIPLALVIFFRYVALSNFGASYPFMQGFGVGAGYTNVNNQLIIIGSYDLIGRTVDSLPFLNVEYIQVRMLSQKIEHLRQTAGFNPIVGIDKPDKIAFCLVDALIARRR